MIQIQKVIAIDNTLVDIGSQTSGFFGYTCIGNLVSNAVAAAFIVAGVATFGYLAWGGLEWTLSGGDKGKLTSAQQRISSAVVGLAIVSLSWAIYQVILIFFGIDLSKLCTSNPV